jgi:hypothetical protein
VSNLAARGWLIAAVFVVVPAAVAQEPDSRLPRPKGDAVAQQPIDRPKAGGDAADATQENTGDEAPQPPLVAIEQAIKSLSGQLTHAVNSQAETADDRQNANDDLKAQQEMAFWALWMVVISGGQLGLTLIGIMLVWKTLQATKDAVREAEAATKAAQAAVEVTKSSAESQLRAYVFPKCATVIESGIYQNIVVHVTIKNYGQTPARCGRIRAAIFVCEEMEFRNEAEQNPGDPVLDGEFAPGGEYTIELRRVGFTQTELIMMQAKHKLLYAHGTIVYIDAFGESISRDFRYEHYIDAAVRNPEGIPMKMSIHGNG